MTKDEKWLQWCVEGAKIFSTCSKKQYMSIIVDKFGYINATGYNGSPIGFEECVNGGCPRAINNVPSGTPYDYGEGLCVSLHAEANALIQCDRFKAEGGTIYVNGFPCFNCAKSIVNTQLQRLVYLIEDFDRIGSEETWKLFDESKLQVRGIELP